MVAQPEFPPQGGTIPRAGATDTNPKRKRGPVTPSLACASGWCGGFTECVIAVRSEYTNKMGQSN